MSATPRPRLRLRREQRLRAGNEFVRLKNEGHRQIQGCLILNWQSAQEHPVAQSRLGVVTSKSIGGAVVRNRARRLLREAFRLHQRALGRPVSMVLVARRSIAGKCYAQVESDLLTAWKRARLLRNPEAPSPS